MASEEGNMVMLMEDSQLKKLAKILLNQEEVLMDAIDSEIDRAKYIEECNDAYDNVITLLNKSSNFNLLTPKDTYETPKDTHDHLQHAINTIMKHVRNWCLDSLVKELENESNNAYGKFINLWKKYNDIFHKTKQSTETSKAEIVKDIQDYVKYAINVSLQCVQDCCLRKRWVSKIEAHFEILVQELEDLNVQNETIVRSMAENVALYKQCMLQYASICGSGSSRVNSEVYLMLLKKEQVQFSDICERIMNELGFAGEFDSLTESQQLEVCRGIVNESGGANMPKFKLAKSGSGSRSGTVSIKSYCLVVEFIFGKGGTTILDVTGLNFDMAQIPDGMALACQIAYGEY